MEFKNHDLTAGGEGCAGVRYEERELRRPDGEPVDGLHTVWITLDNPAQFNSYTTEMVKGVILGMRRASNDRACVAVVFTGQGDRAFCTGGNTEEYAEYYAGRPEEYRQYMRLFNDMVTRDPALRQAGHLPGQRHAHRRRPGDRHGLRLLGRAGPGARSARPGPRTARRPTAAAPTSCRSSSASRRRWRAARSASPGAPTRRYRLGLLSRIVPALKVDGEFVANPLVETDRWIDDLGRIVYGEYREGEALAAAKATLRAGAVDLGAARREVDALVFKLGQHDARLPHQDDRERPQAQARALGQQPRDQPGLARRST